MSYDAIPHELVELDQWVLWRYEDRGGKKPTKVPYQAKDPTKKASSTDPSTWGMFEMALLSRGDDGLGFVLSPDDPFTGVDFDNCIDEKGHISPGVKKWIREIDSYVEISPSGKGLRAFVMADIETGFARNGVEVYANGRFLTVTGNAIKVNGKLHTTISAAQDVIDELIAAHTPAEGDTSGRIKIHELYPGMEKIEAPRNTHYLGWLGELRTQGYSYENAIVRAYELGNEYMADPYAEAELRRSFKQKSYEAWDGPAEEIDPDLDVTEYLKVRRGDKIVMKSIEFLWKPFLQKSAFHLLVGQKGAGKGTLLAYWAAQMTKGAMNGVRDVLWVKTEDSFEIDVVPRFVAAHGDLSRLHLVHRSVRLPEDLPYLERYAAAKGIGMVIFDPLAGFTGKADTNDEGSIVGAIGGLNKLADDLDLIVFGVRHIGKSIDRGALAAVLGGVAWINTPRVVLGLAKDEDVMVLEVLAGNRTSTSMKHEYQMKHAKVAGLEEEVTRVLPMGSSTRSVDDILSKPRNASIKTEEVKKMIFDQLDLHEQLSLEELVPQAISLGSNKATLKALLDEMKDVSIKWLPKGDLPGARWRFTRL